MIKYSSVLDASPRRVEKRDRLTSNSQPVTISISIDFHAFLSGQSISPVCERRPLLQLGEREKRQSFVRLQRIHLACLLMIQDKYYDDRPLPLSWSRRGDDDDDRWMWFTHLSKNIMSVLILKYNQPVVVCPASALIAFDISPIPGRSNTLMISEEQYTFIHSLMKGNINASQAKVSPLSLSCSRSIRRVNLISCFVNYTRHLHDQITSLSNSICSSLTNTTHCWSSICLFMSTQTSNWLFQMRFQGESEFFCLNNRSVHWVLRGTKCPHTAVAAFNWIYCLACLSNARLASISREWRRTEATKQRPHLFNGSTTLTNSMCGENPFFQQTLWFQTEETLASNPISRSLSAFA